MDKTKQALEQLEQDLYIAKPEVIVIISPHGSLLAEAFTINSCTDYETDLRDFGDLTTKLKFKGENALTSHIRQATKEFNLPATMVSEKYIDHGSAVPLFI